MNTGIIVDTSVWIEFFRHSESEITQQLKILLQERRIFMAGMVLAEILQGIKNSKEATIVRQHLEKLPYVEITRDVWEQAGTVSALLRRKGLTIPLSDLIIAALAIFRGFEIFSIDPHFQKVPSLKLFKFTL